jgi:hypothetical protein
MCPIYSKSYVGAIIRDLKNKLSKIKYLIKIILFEICVRICKGPRIAKVTVKKEKM